MKPISAALTTREQDSLLAISGLFQKPQMNGHLEIKKQRVLQNQEIKEVVDLEGLIIGARELLKSQEAKVEQNSTLVQKIDFNKGVVLASTKDFQDSCVSILKREQMLTKVVREIEKNLQHYKNYEELQRVLNYPQLMDQPKELVAVVQKIERGIDFFRENFEFQKAVMYLRRFESMRQQVLETKVYIKLIKIMKELNTECYLRVVQTNQFVKAATIEECEPKMIIYARETAKTQEGMQSFQTLVSTLEAHKHVFADFIETKVYQEYFDHRLYLVEQYLDAVTRILDYRVQLRDPAAPNYLNLHGYIQIMLDKYQYVMGLEEEYYMRQFTNRERFEQFKRENEYDIILHKRFRPHIIGCGDLQSLCDSIDYLRDQKIQGTVLSETIERMHSDLQERLLLISHYQIQNLLAPAISQTYLPVEKLQIIQREDSQLEIVPMHFVNCILDIITNKLRNRISIDIYRGLVLESAQRIVSEHLISNLAANTENQDALLVVHANMFLVKQKLFHDSSNTVQSLYPQNPSQVKLLTTEEEDSLQEEEGEKELDLHQTGQNLWQLLTLKGPKAEYDSVLEFLEESIPKLKSKQQEDMRDNLANRLYQMSQRVARSFIQGTCDEINQFVKMLKNKGALMPEAEQQAVFKSQGESESWAHIGKAKEVYCHTITSLSQQYRLFREKVSQVQELLGYQDEGLYEQLKTDVRVKAMGVIMNFYSTVNKYYDQAVVNSLPDFQFKSIKQLNYEVFGCAIDDNSEESGEVNIIA